MSDLGLLSYYLGIKVNQGPAGIALCQAMYTRKILEKCGLASCNPTATPMENILKLSKSSTEPVVSATEYRSIIGYLSRFMEEPRDDHLAVVKQVLRYLASTQEHGLFYTRHGDGQAKLAGYSDADLAGCVDTRRSTSGIIFFLGGNPISWQSNKQKVVALSSCEAEYMATAAAACQGIWLARLLTDMVGSESGAPGLWVDNQLAIALSKNPVFYDRSKHIDVRYHFIRECVEEGRIALKFITTEQQMADGLMKALGRVRFQELRKKIGINTPGDRAVD
jgi:hypothetical protein